jgi:hypothetical protein
MCICKLAAEGESIGACSFEYCPALPRMETGAFEEPKRKTMWLRIKFVLETPDRGTTSNDSRPCGLLAELVEAHTIFAPDHPLTAGFA